MSYTHYPGQPDFAYPPYIQQQQPGYPHVSQQSQPGYPPSQGAYSPYPTHQHQQPGYPAYPLSPDYIAQSTCPLQPCPTFPGQQPYTSFLVPQPTPVGFENISVAPYPSPQSSSGPSYSSYPTAHSYGPQIIHETGHTPSPQASIPSYSALPTPSPRSQHIMEKYIPSVLPHQPFDPRADADALHKAMKGFGTDEKGLINILCKRTSDQRVKIAQAYKAGYGKDLEVKIKSETSGNFEKVLVALTQSRASFLARELYKAMDGLGTTESALIQVLCSCTNQEIKDINSAYVQMYGRPVENDIKGDTSGTFKMLLVSLAQGQRDESTIFDHHKVKEDAQRLYRAGEAKLGTDESTFNSILATRSWTYLKQLMIEYQTITGHSLEKAVASEFSANAERGLLGILECAQNRAAYFAKVLYKSMKGLGTDDSTLIRVVVSRSDVDLGSIKQEYMRLYGRTLQQDVTGDTSGDYKLALLTLIGS